MKANRPDNLAGALLAGLLSLLGIACFAMAAQGADNMVTISGQLHADDQSLNDAAEPVRKPAAHAAACA